MITEEKNSITTCSLLTFVGRFPLGKNTRSIQFFVKDMAYIMVEFLFSNEQLELRARVKLLHGNSARCRVTGVSIGEMLGKISYLPLASEPALAPSTRVAVREKVVITFSICLQVSTQPLLPAKKAYIKIALLQTQVQTPKARHSLILHHLQQDLESLHVELPSKIEF